MIARKAYFIFLILSLLFVFSCRQKEESRQDEKVIANAIPQKDYLSLIIAMDTLSSLEYKKVVKREYDLLNHSADTANNPFYHYFKARMYMQDKLRDSALMEYEKMTGKSTDDDIELLKKVNILDYTINNGVTVSASVMKKILNALEASERQHSRFIYRFYDLLAKAYFQNDNEKESLGYAERYYEKHPYKSHPVIEQRYYDISFLLASGLGDYEKMKLYNNKARKLAKSIHDSLAIARTYDNEAQVYVRQMKYDKALASSRTYFNYLKKTNNLNDIAYNNLATSFIYNRQPDSAIYYYKEAIAFAKKNPSGKQKPVYYRGLINAYKMIGAHVEALEVAEQAYDLELSNLKEIDAVKVAEIHEKYEAEKKDRNIAELSNRNVLNEKIIQQQRWTLVLASLVFIGILSFLYIIQRQYRLKEKNKLLQSENQRLNIEQKLLQVQLNPHFIFNAIANLQSLIATGDSKESVRYLTAFSRLLRNVLEQNRQDFISLEEEITSLRNYLELQQMRFVGLFDYEISVDEDTSAENTFIPPMLIQPFVENAIEHGFRNIPYKGLLKLSFSVRDQQMQISVDDNGTGFTEKGKSEYKKQSLASIILKERLEVLFKSKGEEAKFETQDKKQFGKNGVVVHIVIPEMTD